jgi:hypothetical protein
MKLTKKLIPAIVMLMFSAVMLVTSSFAWFSMNKDVAATGMSVTAQGKQIYLQIVKDADPFVDGGKQVEATAKTPNNKGTLLPTNVKKFDGATNYDNYDSGEFTWVTAEGTDAENGAVKGEYKPVDEEANHYIKNTFKIRLDPTAGTEEAEAPLKVSRVTFSNQEFIEKTEHLARSVSVLVVCTYKENSEDVVKTQLFTQADVDTSVAESLPNVGVFTKTAGDEALTKGDKFKNPEAGYVTVDIYVFFNGDSKHCTLEALGKAALNNYSVTVGFTVASQGV